MLLNIPHPSNTSGGPLLLAQNHTLGPSVHPLPTLPNPQMLPAMPIPKPPTNSTFLPSPSPSPSNSADIHADTNQISTLTLGITIAGFIVVILLCIFTQIMVIRIRRRQECEKIQWEYPATKTNFGDLSVESRLPLNEAGPPQKTSLKIKGFLRKISHFKVHGARSEHIDLAPIK
ncbi:hypothetical protein PtA15_16A31 [Puccinia triticina]|uniref:Uncharacterized protein n=1 Tax=Puccinia triticina TaxID=208348 RepID=A0ABY7D703_9BASI|nr:uncharacterized protein PtA15_16A31 [Puccinia triticina]WAQ92126.1 hypothetical protein PtA15_16A31 [Puccinia triticina]WAR63873.1 hypothetical protein PtB15_16B32 [Puccinia triticina]